LNPILQKILAATGLTRRGELTQATQTIQKALAEAGIAAGPGSARAEVPTSAKPEPADVLDGLVREIDVIPVDIAAADLGAAPADRGGGGVVDDEATPADAPPDPVARRTPRFSKAPTPPPRARAASSCSSRPASRAVPCRSWSCCMAAPRTRTTSPPARA
jgi:hypothetical protein